MAKNINSKIRKELLGHFSSRQAWLVIIGYITFMIVLAIIVHQYIDRESLHSVVKSTGYFSILIFLLIEYIYIIFVPIYNTTIHLAAGYIFGGHIGWLLNFLATSAGLFTIIFLVKRYGRRLINKIVSEKKLKRYDSLTNRIGPLTLFIIYVLPGFPDDEITYLMAASKTVQFWRFIIPVLLGNVAKAAVSYIGDEGVHGFSMAAGTRIIVFIIGIIIIGIQEFLFHRYYNKN